MIFEDLSNSASNKVFYYLPEENRFFVGNVHSQKMSWVPCGSWYAYKDNIGLLIAFTYKMYMYRSEEFKDDKNYSKQCQEITDNTLTK